MDGIATSQTLPLVDAPQTKSIAPAFWPAFLLAFSTTCITLGTMWDISWHETIGRDTFWTPAHMLIYLGGALGGFTGGWLAIYYTFLASEAERGATVRVLGARAPLGAWLAIWGATAMLTSGPFDNWWHNAYGLDVRIISPPHTVLGLGMFGISVGALLLALSRQNHLQGGEGSGMFIYVGGVFLIMAAVFLMEYTFPNEQHGALFYSVCAAMFPFRMVTMARAARTSFAATRMALIYMGIVCAMVWILPMFAAQPKLAPIHNPVTHMVPPPFPLLLIIPALAVDLVLFNKAKNYRWFRFDIALLAGLAFLVTMIPTQWFFAQFLLSPKADNWFFAGGGKRVWDYGAQIGDWTTEFWKHSHGQGVGSIFSPGPFAKALAIATFSCWIGLLLGGWMRRVQR